MKDRIRQILSEQVSEKIFQWLQKKYVGKVHTIDFERGEKFHYRVDKIEDRGGKGHLMQILMVALNEDGTVMSKADLLRTLPQTMNRYFNLDYKPHHCIILIETTLREQFENILYEYFSIDMTEVHVFLDVDYEK